MRALVDGERLREFMRAFGREARHPGRVYFAGGATAVLSGWRNATIDIDLKLVPDDDSLLRAIPALKERLQINIELATPIDFIPVRAGWEDRSPFIAQEGRLSFHHFDLVAQALAKIERGHSQDTIDVAAMLQRGLISPDHLLSAFVAIDPELYRYPAIDPPAFRRALDAALRAPGPQDSRDEGTR